MLVTVTNTSGATINTLAVAEDGVATGGHRDNALPYPFAQATDLANAGSIVLPMHEADFRGTTQMRRGQPARDQWNQLVQAGTVTFAVAAQSDEQDVEEVFLAAV